MNVCRKVCKFNPLKPNFAYFRLKNNLTLLYVNGVPDNIFKCGSSEARNGIVRILLSVFGVSFILPVDISTSLKHRKPYCSP